MLSLKNRLVDLTTYTHCQIRTDGRRYNQHNCLWPERAYYKMYSVHIPTNQIFQFTSLLLSRLSVHSLPGPCMDVKHTHIEMPHVAIVIDAAAMQVDAAIIAEAAPVLPICVYVRARGVCTTLHRKPV